MKARTTCIVCNLRMTNRNGFQRTCSKACREVHRRNRRRRTEPRWKRREGMTCRGCGKLRHPKAELCWPCHKALRRAVAHLERRLKGDGGGESLQPSTYRPRPQPKTRDVNTPRGSR